jgi:phytoene dehydrogenase-like protein
MQALPKAIHNKLKNTRVLFNEEVKEIAEDRIFLASGDQIFGDVVIVAVDNPALEVWVEDSREIGSKSVRCFYFSALKGQIEKSPFLHLGNDGPITNLCIPNHIQPSYAPKGFDLISATVVDPEWQKKPDLEKFVEENVSSWLSVPEESLSLVKSYHIKHALPLQKAPPMFEDEIKMKGFKRVFLAGEMVQPPSINGALVSGRKAGNAAIATATRAL